jgi:hypothetical protein
MHESAARLMDDFVASFFLGIFEMTRFILLWSVLAILWCVAMALFAVGRLGLSTLRAGHQVITRRTVKHELAFVASEYEAALADIQRIGEATRRQIRELH